jgi:hypothetical protein
MKSGIEIISLLILCHILIAGCLVNQNNTNNLQSTTAETISVTQTVNFPIANETEITPKPSAPDGRSIFDSINVTVHSVETIHEGNQNFVFLNLTIKNEKIPEGFSLDSTTIVCFEQNGGHRFYPVLTELPVEIKDPLIPTTLRPGQEKQGTIVFKLWDSVKSITLYVGYSNWTLLGESVISDISKNSTEISDVDYPKKRGLIVHSAANHHNLPGWNNQPGTRIAEINVSITNYQTYDIKLPRENIFIITERGETLEHGGDSAKPEVARNYIRFPLSISAGETKTGTIVFIVYSGTKTNKLVLTDSNFVINSIVDLNDYYQYF